MPIYEYSCQKCGARLEVMQKITDKPLKRCKNCGGKLEKEWSTTSFQLKGTGWYVTDYAGKKSGAAEAEPSKTATTTETKADGAGGAKTATAAADTPKPEDKEKGKKTPRAAATSKPSKSD